MIRNHPAVTSKDSGFTLLELLVVIVLMGTVTSVLSTALVVALRVNPQTDARLDDARATRALATWLANDTMSAPPFLPEDSAQGGIDVNTARKDCGGDGDNLLHLRWTESSFTSRTFVASYQFDQGRIVRYLCAKTGDGPFVGISIRTLITGLDPLQPPVVTPVQAPDSPVTSITFLLNGKSGEQVAIETASRNPSDFFLP